MHRVHSNTASQAAKTRAKTTQMRQLQGTKSKDTNTLSFLQVLSMAPLLPSSRPAWKSADWKSHDGDRPLPHPTSRPAPPLTAAGEGGSEEDTYFVLHPWGRGHFPLDQVLRAPPTSLLQKRGRAWARMPSWSRGPLQLSHGKARLAGQAEASSLPAWRTCALRGLVGQKLDTPLQSRACLQLPPERGWGGWTGRCQATHFRAGSSGTRSPTPSTKRLRGLRAPLALTRNSRLTPGAKGGPPPAPAKVPKTVAQPRRWPSLPGANLCLESGAHSCPLILRGDHRTDPAHIARFPTGTNQDKAPIIKTQSLSC